MKLSNLWYDRVKWFTQIVIPAIATLYAGLAVFWKLPHGTEVTGTLALVATFLGSVLGVSNIRYNKAANDPDQPPAGVPPGVEEH